MRFGIMMPDPERVLRTVPNLWYPSEWQENGAWLRMLQNARWWVVYEFLCKGRIRRSLIDVFVNHGLPQIICLSAFNFFEPSLPTRRRHSAIACKVKL
ncbi:MAG: phosphoribosylformylglycinamidine synthase subunit PurQ [Pseudomonadota bacterium]